MSDLPARPRADLSLPLTTGPQGARIETPDGVLHYLNPTAAVVWLLCDGSRDHPALAGAVAREFGLADPPTRDVEQALRLLTARGLVQEA
ncbi:PqqD family peptide modification chaperone [Rhodobacterales bacterium HKCCSP123]|nr:PqqD family peptide modification chaperone [Rhodobacterales bacterium HKCCSP123]